MTPTLYATPRKWPLLWQWWLDLDYLAGFLTEERARFYGRLMGWCS